MAWMNLSLSDSKTKRGIHVLARALACSMLLVLTSCAIPPLRPPHPGPGLPEVYPPGLTGANSPENSAQLKVEEFYNDRLLLFLIDQALAGNQELKILNEEVQIAGNAILARRGAYLPFLGFRG